MVTAVRSLDLIIPPRGAVSYQVAPYDSARRLGRPVWGKPFAVGRLVHLDAPHRVRYLDGEGWNRWGIAVVDPDHGGLERVEVMSRRAHRRALVRAAQARYEARLPGSEREHIEAMLARARARVAVLEERLKNMEEPCGK